MGPVSRKLQNGGTASRYGGSGECDSLHCMHSYVEHTGLNAVVLPKLIRLLELHLHYIHNWSGPNEFAEEWLGFLGPQAATYLNKKHTSPSLIKITGSGPILAVMWKGLGAPPKQQWPRFVALTFCHLFVFLFLFLDTSRETNLYLQYNVYLREGHS